MSGGRGSWAARGGLARGLALPLGLGLGLAAGCSGGERIAECDALLATVEEVRACGRLEQGQRAQVEQTVRVMREALGRLEDVGPGRAPAAILDETKRTCLKQEADIRQVYEKVAPGCLR